MQQFLVNKYKKIKNLKKAENSNRKSPRKNTVKNLNNLTANNTYSTEYNRSNLKKQTNSTNVGYVDTKKTIFINELNTKLENSDKQDLIQVIENENLRDFSTKENNFFLTGVDDEKNKNSNSLNLRAAKIMNRIKNNISENNLPNLTNENLNEKSEKKLYDFNECTNDNNSKLAPKNSLKNIYNNAYDNKSILSPGNNYLSSINNQSTEASVNYLNSLNSRLNNNNDKKSIEMFKNFNNDSNHLLSPGQNFSRGGLLSPIYKRRDITVDSLKPPKKIKKTTDEKRNYFDIIDEITKDLDTNFLPMNESNLNESNFKALISPKNNKLNFSISNNQNSFKEKKENISNLNISKDKLERSKFKKKTYKETLDITNINNVYDASQVNILSSENNNSNFLDKGNLSNLIIDEDNQSNINFISPVKVKIPRKKVTTSKNFLEKFKERCNTEVDNYNNILKDIKYDIKLAPKIDKDKINIFRDREIEEQSKAIDKYLYFMDGVKEPRDKILILLTEETKDGKQKFISENKNNPLFIGELISHINEKFAYKCKDLFMEQFIINSNEKKERRVQKEIEEMKEYQKILDKKHKNVKDIIDETEKMKYLSNLRNNNIFEKN